MAVRDRRAARARRGRAARPVAAVKDDNRRDRRAGLRHLLRLGAECRQRQGPVRAAASAAPAAVLHRAAEPQSAAHESVLPAAGVSFPASGPRGMGDREPPGLRVEHLGKPARASLAPAAGRLDRARRLSAGVGTRRRVLVDAAAQFSADGPGDRVVARGARGQAGGRRGVARARGVGQAVPAARRRRTSRCGATGAPFVPLRSSACCSCWPVSSSSARSPTWTG